MLLESLPKPLAQALLPAAKANPLGLLPRSMCLCPCRQASPVRGASHSFGPGAPLSVIIPQETPASQTSSKRLRLAGS